MVIIMIDKKQEEKAYLSLPLWDSSLSVPVRIASLLSNLTLEEKFRFLATSQPALLRLGILEYSFGGEAAHGIEARHDQGNIQKPEETTSFIQPIGMSASFDEELIQEAGRIAGTEARVLYSRHKTGGLCRWAPTVDMERDPRWGRTEEGYGEDPCLTGKMASAYIRGLQGTDEKYLRMAAAVKHFYANNVEEGRVYKSSSIDPRNKYEYYLPPFKRTVEEGGVEAMMTAYNEINGVPALVNSEVKELVKEEWGLRGHVVCDGGDMMQTVTFHHYCGTHAQTVAEGLKAGIDCFTDDAMEVEKAAREAYALGLIDEEDIDRALSHTFGTRIRLGLFDAVCHNPYAKVGEGDINTVEGREISRLLSEEGAVLLKNENGFLPFGGGEKIAVIGPCGDAWFKDWYGGEPPYRVTPLEGIEAFLGKKVSFETGLPQIYLRCLDGYVGVDEHGRMAYVKKKEDALCLVWNEWGAENSTFCDLKTGKYVSYHEEDNYFAPDRREVFGWFVKERFGVEEEHGICRLYTWNKKPLVITEEGIICTDETKETAEFQIELHHDGFLAAAELAGQAERVIFVGGCQPLLGSKEEIDRTDLRLPVIQEKLIREVVCANPNTALVLMTNYPYAISWEQAHIPAILQMATGSQELGNALANLIFGKTSPAGRLPMTWYHGVEDLPEMDDYDIIKGRRTYRYFEKDVLYPFGHGLTYTSFSYGQLYISIKDSQELMVQFTVKNIGTAVSDEVVQLYAERLSPSRIKHPNRRLIGFMRLKRLKAGEVRQVVMRIPLKELCVYDVTRRRMLMEEGEYRFFAGGSSIARQTEQTVFVPGDKTGVRNTGKMTMADHYDDYENVFLHQADVGGTCAVVKDPEKEASLFYRDFCWTGRERRIILNAGCIGTGSLKIYLNDILAAEWEGSREQHFSNQSLALKQGLPEGEMVEVKIELSQDMRVSRFWFA